jgi:hypothetical protein
MENDMTFHDEAQQDCIHTLQDYPLLGTTTNDDGHDDDPREVVELTKDYLQSLETSPGGSLTIDELQLLLIQKQFGPLAKTHLVSLGDLGRKDDDDDDLNTMGTRNPGTTECFQTAKEYLDRFVEYGVPSYDIVTGNHDLEGLDEFMTDEDNLQAWMDCFDKTTPYFSTYISDKTLLIGLSTVRFRDAPYSSHEVYVDDQQVEWFQHIVESHPFEDGWKILVFSHAPIIGSGLKFIQNVHVINGCAWINHSDGPTRRNKFIRIVQNNPQIVCWLSGHFHLSHDFHNSCVQSLHGQCTFIQVGVMGKQSTRDHTRQTRFLRGCSQCIEIYSINHHIRIPVDGSTTNTKADVRLDATIDLKSGKLVYAHETTNGEKDAESSATRDDDDDDEWFHAFVPQEEDGCYLNDSEDDGSIDDTSVCLNGTIGYASSCKVCWWHMADGKVLGLHQGHVVEYDAETLAPLGVVVMEDQLNGREVMVVQNKTTLVLVDDNTKDIEVIHPNSDGSYWRKLQRNKKIRVEEKAREEVAKRWIEQKQRQQRT